MEMMAKAMVDGSLEDIATREKREREIKEQFGDRAQRVEKYKPNRKQKRAQESAARQAKGKKKGKV